MIDCYDDEKYRKVMNTDVHLSFFMSKQMFLIVVAKVLVYYSVYHMWRVE